MDSKTSQSNLKRISKNASWPTPMISFVAPRMGSLARLHASTPYVPIIWVLHQFTYKWIFKIHGYKILYHNHPHNRGMTLEVCNVTRELWVHRTTLLFSSQESLNCSPSPTTSTLDDLPTRSYLKFIEPSWNSSKKKVLVTFSDIWKSPSSTMAEYLISLG